MDELRERAERWLRERYKDNPRYVVDPSDVNLLADFATEVVRERDQQLALASLAVERAVNAAKDRDAEIARLKREVEEEKAKQRTDERQCDEMTATAAALAQENARLKRQVEAGEKLAACVRDNLPFIGLPMTTAPGAMWEALGAFDAASKPEVG